MNSQSSSSKTASKSALQATLTSTIDAKSATVPVAPVRELQTSVCHVMALKIDDSSMLHSATLSAQLTHPRSLRMRRILSASDARILLASFVTLRSPEFASAAVKAYMSMTVFASVAVQMNGKPTMMERLACSSPLMILESFRSHS